ncbi:MAG: hypothetical protein OHK0012_16070 [Synechococcales cyanobacterium]
MGNSAISLASLWAQKYVTNLGAKVEDDGSSQLAEKVRGSLRFASSQAWAKTEQLLAKELDRNRLDPELLDPWQIAEDSRQLFKRAAGSLQAHIPPARFSTEIAAICGHIRRRYTRTDPRVLGFMSMQFHFTGQKLLESLSTYEQSQLFPFLKVMDDQLYMPLHRTYLAAAQAHEDAPALKAMQELLLVVTPVAEAVCAEAAHHFPQYRTDSGSLSNVTVRVSSIRDTEMFLIYLGLCTLEGSISAVQEELFPLCVMLYPPLRVGWNLVRFLLSSLENLLPTYLSQPNYATLAPNLKAIQDMFSLEVFPETDSAWNHHPDVVRWMNAARELMPT